jgi:uncharacterized hydrophobic protein (TIGR00271 family)|tara:strand:- start:71844 stop:72962 length:1119 start_codon:yes stop_codon:yes gene_type:complete
MTVIDESTIKDKALKPRRVRPFINRLYRASKKTYRFMSNGDTLRLNQKHIDPAREQSNAKISARIRSNALISYEFLAMNAFATIIACCGLATNNTLALIGAITIAMLLDPVMGISLAIVEGDKKLLARSLFAEMSGALTVLIGSFLFSILYRYHITDLPESNLMQYATPNLLDLVIAIISGAAGAYSTLSRQLRVSLVGAALSITLLPPLAACGIFLAHGSISLASSSFLSFSLNFVAIQFTSSIVFSIYGFQRDVTEKKSMYSILEKNKLSILVILFLATILTVNLSHVLHKLRFEQDVKRELRHGLNHIPGAFLAELRFKKNHGIVAVVRATEILSASQVNQLRDSLPLVDGKKPNLNIRVVKVTDLSPS